jgi:flagellar basal-body rod protein FlgB
MLFDTTQLALEGVISGAAQRHQALATNIANANTPGYQRVDVDFHAQLAAALGRSGDAGAAIESMSFTPQRDATAGAVQADGSTVDSERESASLAANALESSAAITIAQTRIHILQNAMGAPGH